jgi:PAS domain S-box-containing protein
MAMLLTTLVYMAIDYYLVYNRNTRMLETEIALKIAKAAKTLAHPLWIYDVNFIREYSKILTHDNSVVRVTVYDERNKSLVHLENIDVIITPSTLKWILHQEILFQNRSVGRLVITFCNAEVNQLTRQILLSDISMLFSMLLVVLATTWFLLARQIFTPLTALEHTLKKISTGDYSRRVSLHMKGELGSIADEFNTMVEQVELRENKIRESELKYRNLVESSTDIIFMTDIKGELLFMNHNFQKLTGYRIENFIGRPFTDMLSSDDIQISLKMLEGGLKGIAIPLYEIEFRQKDGTTVPMELNLTLQRDINHTPFGALGIARDIAKRKHSETELRKYEQMIASTTDLMWLIDRDYTIQAVNDAYAKHHHADKNQLIGLNAEKQVGHAIFEKHIKPYVDRCFTGNNVRHYSWIGLPGPEARYMEITYHPNFEPDKTVSGVVISERDISERKKLENQLQQTQKMEAIGTLAGGIAHDFNNILGSIIGYGEMMEMFDVQKDTKSENRLNHILKGAYRARDLVDQILTFSRHTDQQKKPLRLTPILKEALNFLRASLPATIRIDENLNCRDDVILANPTQIHQVLMNLCTNASQAMADSGGTITVALNQINHEKGAPSTRLDLDSGAYVRISVADKGTGIDNAIIDKIFDPFFTTKKPDKGTGMGLAVVHGIVTNHNGIIEVENGAEGTTFSVYFPLLDIAPVASETAGPLSLPSGQGQILFIDDEKPLVQFSKEILEYLGYTVTAKTDSIKALEAFKQTPDLFDLVITDQTMPNMTGLDLAKKILAVKPDLPIVLCTGFDTETTEKKALAAGIHTYIKKPLGPRKLAMVVSKILNRNHPLEIAHGQHTDH